MLRHHKLQTLLDRHTLHYNAAVQTVPHHIPIVSSKLDSLLPFQRCLDDVQGAWRPLTG